MAWYSVRHVTPSARLPGQQDVQVDNDTITPLCRDMMHDYSMTIP